MIYTRYADDMVVLIDGHSRWQPHVIEIKKRLQGELGKVEVELNEEKTRVVDLGKAGSFGLLGFDLREEKNRMGKRFIMRTPMKKKRVEYFGGWERYYGFTGTESSKKSLSGFASSLWDG